MKYLYFVDNGFDEQLDGTIEANDKDDAYKQVELLCSEDGIDISDAVIDIYTPLEAYDENLIDEDELKELGDFTLDKMHVKEIARNDIGPMADSIEDSASEVAYLEEESGEDFHSQDLYDAADKINSFLDAAFQEDLDENTPDADDFEYDDYNEEPNRKKILKEAYSKQATDLLDKIEKICKYRKIDGDCFISSDNFDNDGIVEIGVDIHWGDWKHDHMHLDWAVQDVFDDVVVNEEVTEEDGSDTYSSTHYYTFYLDDELNEDTVKNRKGKWVNRGKEGTHGEFKTKKAADAQRKAMFANGFTEALIDEYTESLEDTVDQDLSDNRQPEQNNDVAYGDKVDANEIRKFEAGIE